MNLPPEVQEACAPLFQAAPFDEAMPELTGSRPKLTELVEEILAKPAMHDQPELAAGLWLYVDDLERSHTVSQGIDGPRGALWHGIMHRREGDFSNSHYWMRRATGHPILMERPELDPAGLVDAVSQAHGANPPELVQRQREEWRVLFEWCVAQPVGHSG